MSDLDVTPAETVVKLSEHVAAAINQVLEDERGSVLALVQLSTMATDAQERHALAVAGGQAAHACVELRTLLNRGGAPVSVRVGGGARIVQDLERVDDRYMAFEQVQQRMMAALESIRVTELDAPAKATLAMTHTLQAAHGAWALQRARTFAASREETPAVEIQHVDATAGRTASSDVTSALSQDDSPLVPPLSAAELLAGEDRHVGPTARADGRAVQAPPDSR